MIASSNYEMFRFLVTRGAKTNVESPGESFRYPLIEAVYSAGLLAVAGNKRRGDAEKIVFELISAGAWVSVVDSAGNTPLHYAAKYSLRSVAESLINHGAKVSPVNNEGKTPLDFAVDGQVIRLLKANGAQESLPKRDPQGR
jgi:ankyrin repeat protein